MAICRMLLRHFTCPAAMRALLSAGNRMAIRSAMIPMTTSSSTSVKAGKTGRAGEDLAWRSGRLEKAVMITSADGMRFRDQAGWNVREKSCEFTSSDRGSLSTLGHYHAKIAKG